MRIALIGYGKMGREVEQLALEKGHRIVLVADLNNKSELTVSNLRKADVVIEFTRPESVVANLEICLEAGIPVVTGTTGWYQDAPHIFEKFRDQKGSLLVASNFSLGVQVFFQMNRKLAAMMNRLPDYDISIKEVHHLQKIDKPSGTAITMALGILNEVQRKKSWQLSNEQEVVQADILQVVAERREGVVGFHSVSYRSAIDQITLSHEAFNRKGFAEGALAAAAWLKEKKGVFHMEDFVNEILFS